jgi:transposase
VSTHPSLSSRPSALPAVVDQKGELVRFIGLDVGQEACEVAIAEDGRIRSAGRIKTLRAELELFAQSLGPEDQVALEAGSSTLAIARILEPHVARVVVANTKKLRQISHAKAKTDTLDARTLARLLAAGFLDEVWVPDEPTRALRRWIARRAQLVRQRTRAKNEIHAVIARTLSEGPPATDLFGKRGREWLAEQRLPFDEQITVEGCLRQIAFLDGEVAIIERVLAQHALGSPEIRRLLTVPGVDLVVAATFMAYVGDISRFPSPRRLVGYFGLDPRVRQSGSQVARHGRISKEGASEARHVLCEAAKVAARTPGPLRSFAQRIRARRGTNVATIAVARKLCVIFWHLLTRGEDYAYARPSLTESKLRRIELLAGAPRRQGQRGKTTRPYRLQEVRDRERELSAQAERAYQRLVADWQQQPEGAGAAPGRASQGPSTGQAARQTPAPTPAL